MQRFLICSAMVLLLAACGGGDTVSCDNGYWGGGIGTCLPDGWHIVERDQLDERGVPGEVIVAFQSDLPYAGQFATVLVTREALAQPLTSEEYSDASVLSTQTLPGYEEIDQQTVTIDNADVTLHVFTAQPRDDQPASRFFQVSAVNGDNTGYTFTGATPVSVPGALEQQITSMLENVTFRGPDEESEK